MPFISKYQTPSFTRTEQEIASLQKEVAGLSSNTSANSPPAPNVPLICGGSQPGQGFEGSGGFVIAAVQDKKGELDTFCTQAPVGCTRIGFLIGKTSDQTNRDLTLFHWVDVPDDIAASGGHFECQYPIPLKYDTQYGLIQLIAVVEDPVTGLVGRKKNPTKVPWNSQTGQYSYLTTWTTGDALNAPGAPDCTNDILLNRAYFDHKTGHAQVQFRVWADPTHTKTFAQQEAIRVTVYLYAVTNGVTSTAALKKSHLLDATEIGQTSVTFEEKLPLGQLYNWGKNAIEHGTGRSFSATSTCTFDAGGFDASQADLQTFANGIVLTFNQLDIHHMETTVAFTRPQPSAPTGALMLKKLQIIEGLTNPPTDIELVDELHDEAVTLWVPGITVPSRTYRVKTKGGVTHYAKVRLHAMPGLIADSNVFNTLTGADVTNDPGPCAAPPGLTATWEAPHVTYQWQQPQLVAGGTANAIQYYNVWATDLTGTQFMQMLSTPATKAGQLASTQSKAGSLVTVKHPHLVVKIKLKNVAAAFLSGFTLNVSAVNLVNGVLTEGSGATATVVPGVDYLNATDAVNALDVSTTVYSPGQILFNGDFLYASDSALNPTQLNQWFTDSSFTTHINNQPSSNTYWWQPDDSVIFNGLGSSIWQNLKKRLSPGDYFTLSWLARSNGTPSAAFNINLIAQGGGIVGQATVNATLGASYVLYGALLQISPSTPPGTSVFLNFDVSGSISGSGYAEVDRLMMVRGRIPSAFTPRTLSYETGAGGNENPDIGGTSQATGTQDNSNPTFGSQGSWVTVAGIGIQVKTS